VVATLPLSWFCLTACVPQQHRLTFEQRLAIYERANLELLNAVLFKPAETGPTNTLASKLAPLLLAEVQDINQAPALPVVYFKEGEAIFSGSQYQQVTFVWNRLDSNSMRGAEPTPQGIRITLNTSGSPVIWEVLVDNSGGNLIFVSQSLETAALKEFGPPLPGRRFAIESSFENAPNTIVARVIEDGPVPMGPIVHLVAGSRNVSTLICRCMPTQAKNLLATQTYELRPIAESQMRPALPALKADVATRLLHGMRIPPDF